MAAQSAAQTATGPPCRLRGVPTPDSFRISTPAQEQEASAHRSFADYKPKAGG